MGRGERKPGFSRIGTGIGTAFLYLFLASLLLGAGSPDSGAVVVDTGADDSPVVGIEQAGKVVCSGILVDARVVVTAASCVSSGADSGMASSFCVVISDSCVVPSVTSFDPANRIAAITLPSDATPIPIPYGRTDAPPGVGDQVQSLGYGDGAVPLLSIVSTDGQIYNVAPGAAFFTSTDLGSAATFTPETSANGSPVESVYGILLALPSASSANLVYARLDVLARGYLDPVVQATRDVEVPGGCSMTQSRKRSLVSRRAGRSAVVSADHAP